MQIIELMGVLALAVDRSWARCVRIVRPAGGGSRSDPCDSHGAGIGVDRRRCGRHQQGVGVDVVAVQHFHLDLVLQDRDGDGR